MRVFSLILLLIPMLGHALYTNLNIQSCRDCFNDNYSYNIGIMKMSKGGFYYWETGLLGMFGKTSSTPSKSQSYSFEKEYTNSAYGPYGGIHLSLYPILRPGIVFGSLLADKRIYVSTDNQNYSFSRISDYSLIPYFGFSLHMGILSFVLSNIGIGFGLNFNFGR